MIHDLTITLNEETLPFLPAGDPHMVWAHRADHAYAPCQASIVLMPSHLGTHVDAPLHYIKDGTSTEFMPLSAYCGEAVCIEDTDFKPGVEYDPTDVLKKNEDLIKDGDIVIIRTGYEEMVGTVEYFDFPDFTENTGALLESYGIKGLGFDSPSAALKNRAHQEILGRGIGIIESLVNLKPLVGKRFFFSAVPLKFEAGDGSPVRAYAITED